MASAHPDRLYVGERRPEQAPLPRKIENSRVQSPSLLLFVLVAMVGVLAYTVFLLNPSTRGDLLPYSLVIVAELVLVAQATLSMWTILSGGTDPRDFGFHHAQERLYDTAFIRDGRFENKPTVWPMLIAEKPITVDVFITVYGESLETIERTLVAAIAMRGEHRTWVLDDGRSDEVRALVASHGARYIRRLTSHGAKAGNVNHALSIAKGEFFAIFDADFVPKHDFLYETLPFFIDDDVAFVQTPQAYGNMNNMISRGAGYMQAVFYRFVQPGRNSFNAAFCVGTNVVFRRTAVLDVGGICTDSKSEDVWTSLFLHERGWRSIYIPVTLAVGNAPETIEDYSKQQMRWASGGFEILLRHNPLSPRRNLTADQRVQYTITATHYLVGIVPLLLLLVPPMEIFFDLRPVNLTVTWLTWVLFYFGFYGLQIMLAFTTMGSFRPETLMLASVSFPIYVTALVNVMINKQEGWHVTGGARKRKSPFNFMVWQVLTFIFLVLTSAVAIYKDLGNGTLTLATAWNLTNTVILGAFLIAGLQEERQARLARRAERVLTRSLRPRVAPAFGRPPIQVAAMSAATPTAALSAPEPVLAGSSEHARSESPEPVLTGSKVA